MKEVSKLFDNSVDDLAILAEEGARASSRAVPRFIEPMKGTLRRAQSRRHHLIFGRRGSGKSSLLYKSVESLKADGFAVVFIDLEPFIASGGVIRDFLGIFRRAIDEARERLSRDPQHARGNKISAEDVNMATGTYGDTKREEFQKDTLEDQERLDNAFNKIRRFCLEKNKSNIFLIDQDVVNEHIELVHELVDLRLVHHVKSRVTVSSRPGRVYRALLLDVSQYTGERKRRDIEMIEFWKENREALRKASLIYDPSQSMAQLDNEIEQKVVVPPKPAIKANEKQGSFGFD